MLLVMFVKLKPPDLLPQCPGRELQQNCRCGGVQAMPLRNLGKSNESNASLFIQINNYNFVHDPLVFNRFQESRLQGRLFATNSFFRRPLASKLNLFLAFFFSPVIVWVLVFCSHPGILFCFLFSFCHAQPPLSTYFFIVSTYLVDQLISFSQILYQGQLIPNKLSLSTHLCHIISSNLCVLFVAFFFGFSISTDLYQFNYLCPSLLGWSGSLSLSLFCLSCLLSCLRPIL